jgi:protein-S-isoprenylcysteine O-methyltransferase Ste14
MDAPQHPLPPSVAEWIGLRLLILVVDVAAFGLFFFYRYLGERLLSGGVTLLWAAILSGALVLAFYAWDGVVFYALAPNWKRAGGPRAFWPAFLIGFAPGPGSFAGYAIWLYSRGGLREHGPLWLAVAGALIAVGSLAYATCVGNSFGPENLFGYYVYCPQPRERLVTEGAFHHVRNPIYSLFLAVAFGLSLVRWRLYDFVGVVVLWLGFEVIVHFEEHHLLRAIGAPYREYLGRVPRFLPKLRR